jgi:putative DNA primase/helicase
LRGVTESVRRRFHIIPFDVIIPASERDPKLKEKLMEEWPGILHSLIEGCL